MVIDTLQLDIIVNNKGTTQRINNTTKSLQNLYNVIQQINGAGGVNGAVNGGGGSSGTSSRSSGASRASNTARNLNKALNIGSIVGKLYFVRNVTKQLGQNMAQVLQYGIDYEETLNLWQVAMRGNISQARIFVSEMNKAYGVPEATLMNYQAIFRNMLSALGNISEASSYMISESLTQMALDFASLYNVSVESAMTKFQAVLSGQVRPIRTAGYDITEQTLFQLYQQLGGTKTVRQLNQTEKQLLRILAVFKQMETVGATGDLRKTIESSANQLRIMKEQAKDFVTWVGISLNLLLQESGILVTINGYLIALKELAKSIAFDLGYPEKNFMIEFAEGAEDANKEVDELKGKLLGFDKFQVLSSAGTEDVGIEQTLLDALGAYDSILDGFENHAVAKAEELLKAMGLHLEDIVDEEGNVIGQVWKVAEGEETVLDKLKDIGKSILGIATFIGLMTKPWLVLIGAIEIAYLTNEDFRESMNKMFFALASSGITIFKNLAEILADISPALTAIVGGFAEIVAFLDKIGLLEVAIWGVVVGLTAWKVAQVALQIKSFVTTIQTLVIPAITTFANTIKVKLIAALLSLQLRMGSFQMAMAAASISLIGFGAAIALAFVVFQNWEYMNGIEKMISVIGILTVVCLSAAIAFGAFHSAWSMGIAVAGIVAGIVAVTAAVMSARQEIDGLQIPTQFKANGGLATKGSLFYAGEAGPELVTQTSGGGSTIMNMRQLEDAVARGFIRGFASTDRGYEDNDTTDVYVDGQKLFNIMRGTAKRNGYDFVRV